ncbi:MAG: diacylglycerol/polyprenol kinase family protein [Myxococcota bacterium]
MTTAELMEDKDLALQLHRVLSEIDPARWRSEMASRLRPRLTELQQVFQRKPQHQHLAQTLEQELPNLEDDKRRTWLAFKKRVQPAYMELARQLQAASIHVPNLRPTNYARSLFHVASATFAVFAIEWLASPGILLGIAVAWAAFAWTCEISRRLDPRINTLLMKFFGPVAHEHEAHRVNSATWYATALVLLALTRSTTLCVAGVAVLGVGDPMAALVGRRFGRIRLLHGRSLEGTLAFVLAGSLATFGLLVLFHGAMGVGAALVLALAAGIAGAIAELVSLRVDDNFSIPLSAGAGVALMATLLGVAF